MGNPRKPTQLKLIQGTDRATRANRLEPKPATRGRAVVAPPAHMTDKGREAWAILWPQVACMGVLTVADSTALERMAECYAEILMYQASLQARGGAVYETQTIQGGRMFRAYPEAALLADADRRFRGYLGDFGLTPSSRSKVQVAPEGKAADPTAKYFGS